MLKGSGDFNEECFHKCGQHFSKELTIPWAAVSKHVTRGEQPSTVCQSWAGKLWLTESRKGWGQTTVRVSKVIFQGYPETKIEQGFCLALPLTGFCFRESRTASCILSSSQLRSLRIFGVTTKIIHYIMAGPNAFHADDNTEIASSED